MSSPSSSSIPLRRVRSLGDVDVRTPSASRSPNPARFSVEPTPRRAATTDASPAPQSASRTAGPSTSATFRSNRSDDVYLTIAPSGNESLDVPPVPHHHHHRYRTHRPHRMPTVQEPTTPNLPQQNSTVRTYPPGIRGRIKRILVFFGHGPNNHARKELVALIWNLCFGFVQFAVALSFIVYSTKHPAIGESGISEWIACDKPLGVWNSLWLVRVFFGCLMTCWNFTRDRKLRKIEEENHAADAEAAAASSDSFDFNPFDAALAGDLDTANNPNTSTANPNTPASRRRNSNRRSTAVLPYSKLYAKLSLLLSLFSMTWFLTAHILVYTSLDSCRRTSPHLWWLTFGILCILYIMILEVFVIAVIVFIIGPLIYLFWNILLICLGRHPLQNPHFINPDVQKLPKSVVEKIPLVVYIPPPPEEGEKDVVTKPTPIYTRSNSEHTYPPKTHPAPKRRFTFIRSFSSRSAKTGRSDEKKADNSGDKGDSGEPLEWEDQWEGSEYPFVRLDGNRAACAICLMDFEEPKRVSKSVIKSWTRKSAEGKEGNEEKGKAPSIEGAEGEKEGGRKSTDSQSKPSEEGSGLPAVEESHHEIIQEVPAGESSELRLEDAGQGSQPLRLLPCGHVFHKTCIDPWLIDVSGRCPTCQQPVTVPDPQDKKKRGSRRR